MLKNYVDLNPVQHRNEHYKKNERQSNFRSIYKMYFIFIKIFRISRNLNFIHLSMQLI